MVGAIAPKILPPEIIAGRPSDFPGLEGPPANADPDLDLVRFKPDAPVWQVPKLFAQTAMVIGLGLLLPSDSEARPVSDEELERLQREREALESLKRRYAFNNEEVPGWLREALALMTFYLETAETADDGRRVIIRNTAGGDPQAAPPPEAGEVSPHGWEKLIDKDPVAFLRAVRQWDVATRHTIAAKIDEGGSAPEILEWFKATLLPTTNFLGTLMNQPRRWPEDRRGLVHDLKARIRGVGVTEIYLEDGNLARVKAMFNLKPDNLLETVIAIQFELETVLFSIDGLRGMRLAPAFSPGLFNSILKNLIDNAVAHPGIEPLQITVSLRGQTLTVRDNGAGMTRETLDAIRNGTPIHNGIPVDPDGPDRGHGEGWSKSIRNSCDRLGIRWAIDSEEGKGTTVTLTLPLGSLVLDE